MKLFTRLLLGVAIVQTLMVANQAEARKSDREGLTFGSSFRLLDNDDRGEQSAISQSNTRTKSAGQAFSPYLGYSFDSLALGVMLNLENKAEQFTERSPTTGQELSRDASTAAKSMSLYSRFNFGKVMFFQAGAGVYSQTTNIQTEMRSVAGGSFVGTSEEYKIAGVGAGYHLGGGIEIPASNGFYFSGSYIVHNYQLRDSTRSSYGRVIGSQQKRELSFGLAYYN